MTIVAIFVHLFSRTKPALAANIQRVLTLRSEHTLKRAESSAAAATATNTDADSTANRQLIRGFSAAHVRESTDNDVDRD